MESSGGKSPLPRSMWPKILEKAFEPSDNFSFAKDPTGVHYCTYLLRNGPALASRTNFGVASMLSSSSNGDGDAKGKGKNPYKHKFAVVTREDDRG